ncbi:unnamed protein product [Nesidiocoris tenuis]|uniref:Uncharacterized protein n=1 Tax=Nesidiocoris tenuis TaxID=355587 RepID=A0A6H5G029_9HEMI|nr:unnamed protein product [Nesidiocoris tenuis]
MLSTTSENVQASSNTQPGIDENSEIPLITGAVERLSMNTQGHKEVHQSSSIGVPVNNERTAPNTYCPPAKAGCDNMSSAEAATKRITPISSYSHNPILSVDNIDDSDWDSLYDDRGDCIIPHVEAQHSRGKSKHQVTAKYKPEEILGLNLPIVKTRPISQGIALSQEKAKNLVLPSALRPKTCTALARRLVSGALGLRVSVTPAERAAERELLKEARGRKHLSHQSTIVSPVFCQWKTPYD